MNTLSCKNEVRPVNYKNDNGSYEVFGKPKQDIRSAKKITFSDKRIHNSRRQGSASNVRIGCEANNHTNQRRPFVLESVNTKKRSNSENRKRNYDAT